MLDNNPARELLETIIPSKKLRELCEEYGIKAEEGATYKDLLVKSLLKRAEEGNKEAAKLVKEFNIHE